MLAVGLSPVKWTFFRGGVFEISQRVFLRGEGFSPGEEVFPREVYVVDDAVDVVVDELKLDQIEIILHFSIFFNGCETKSVVSTKKNVYETKQFECYHCGVVLSILPKGVFLREDFGVSPGCPYTTLGRVEKLEPF